MQKPLIPITLAYISGLVFGHVFLYLPWSTAALFIILLATAGVLARTSRLFFRRLLLVALPCIIGIAAYVYSAAWIPENHYTRTFAPGQASHEIVGTIISPLDRDPDRTGFVMSISEIDRTPVSGKIRVIVREELTTIGFGDTLRVTGKLFEPRGFDNPNGFDYAAHLARSGVYATVSVKNAGKIEVLLRGAGVFRTIQNWRERIRQAFLTSTSGPGSAIIQAMTLGEEGRLTDELRDRFMAAGVTHIISISGSHLGMVAIICFGLIRGLLFLLPERHYHRLTLCADPKKIAAWLTLPLVLFYSLLAGGQVSTVRSLIMISAGLLALILDREQALMHALALAALGILIVTPEAIFDISFQLSYISVFVIGYVVTLWNDLGIEARSLFQKFRNSVGLLIIISLATGLATGPVVAHYFNQISFAGVVANMIVVPFAGMLVVPLGLFTGILSLFVKHLPLAGLNQFVADQFVNVVAFFSRLPFAEFHPPAPSIPWLVLSALFLCSGVAVARPLLLSKFKPLETSSRAPRKAIVGMAISAALLILLMTARSLPLQHTVVSFPDVGQGDGALLELPSGKTILIDGGGSRENLFDIGRRVLAPYLWNKGIRRLDIVILSHPHPDHMNGLLFILKTFDIGEVWTSGQDTALPGYDEFMQVLRARGIPHRVVSADDHPVMLGAASLEVLHPAHGYSTRARQAYAAENDRSIVVRIRSEGRTFLFTGDIGAGAEKEIVRKVQDLSCDLMKVPHHGSKSSSSELFISTTRPKTAIVTVGRGNPYRHPSATVLQRYSDQGTSIYRTDQGGALRVTMQEDKVAAVQWKERMLHRIKLGEWQAWKKQEQENWKRLLIRAAGL